MLGDVADRRPSSLRLHDTLLSLCARRGAWVPGGPSACPAERMRAATAGPSADPSGLPVEGTRLVLLGPASWAGSIGTQGIACYRLDRSRRCVVRHYLQGWRAMPSRSPLGDASAAEVAEVSGPAAIGCSEFGNESRSLCPICPVMS